MTTDSEAMAVNLLQTDRATSNFLDNHVFNFLCTVVASS